VPISTKLPLGIALVLWVSLADAQRNLGELLDAGARMLSPEEFQREVVQRLVVGPTASGGSLEVMYATNGSVQGIGTYRQIAQSLAVSGTIFGEWTISDNKTICTSMRISGPPIGIPTGGVVLPRRCQFWFKYAEQYFISDSDWDRSAKVLSRTVKQ
jgi:hypothetical protein